MASVGKDPGGKKRILFVAGDGKRKTLRLGKSSMTQASSLRAKVESLVASQLTGRIDDEVARWLGGLGDRAYAKLVAVGLVPARPSTASGSKSPATVETLAAFLDSYITSRRDVKVNTTLVYGRTRKHLVEHFGADKLLGDITPGDADEWRLHLVDYGLAPNTVNRTCGVARQFFRAAVRRRLIVENPFAELKVGVKGNVARQHFVTREDIEKIVNMCPCVEWKLVVLLARYAGLRTPSETLLLRWSDINWEQGWFTAHSPKTEHHPGGESRRVPLFSELKSYLLEAFAEAEPGAEFVIAKHRRRGANLRTHLLRIMARAGVKPWPKLLQNMRSSRQTELAQQWPEYLVCAWLGNSRVIAREHYLQVTDEHFRQASGGGQEKAAQNPAQQTRETACGGLQAGGRGSDNNAVLQPAAANCTSPQNEIVGGRGLEPLTPSVSSWCSSHLS